MKLSTLTKDKIKQDKTKDKKVQKKRNPVAQNVRSGLNRSVKMKDRKRASKRGAVKHKRKMFETVIDGKIFD